MTKLFPAAEDSVSHLLSLFPGIPLTVNDYIKRMDEVQGSIWPTVPLLPGVEKLVHHLKRHNILMAIATGSRKRNYLLKTSGAQVQSVFQHFDLEKNVVTGDPLPEDPRIAGQSTNQRRGIRKGRGKPHPDIFLVAAKECLGRDVGDTSTGLSVGLAEESIVERKKGLVFEDAIPGVIAAKRAGMNGIEDHRCKLEHFLTPPMQLFGLQSPNFVPSRWIQTSPPIKSFSHLRSFDLRNGGFLRMNCRFSRTTALMQRTSIMTGRLRLALRDDEEL